MHCRYKAKQVVDMFLPSFPTFEDSNEGSISNTKLSGSKADEDDPKLSLIKAHGKKQALPLMK